MQHENSTTIERAREDRTTRSFLDGRYEDGGGSEVTVNNLAVYVPKLYQVLGSSVVGVGVGVQI